MIFQKFLFIVLFFSITCFAENNPVPPKVFIDKGACPFECCKYGEWVAKTDIDLKDKIDGQSVIEKIKNNEKVHAITGEVHTIPNAVEIIRNHGKFKKGDKIYLLTYQGEGFYKTWFNGSISSEEILFPGFTESYEFKNCDPLKNDCWGQIINTKRESVWWVKLKTRKGQTGWTHQSKEFLGQDSCS